MAKKATTVPSTHSLWDLIDDDSRRALVALHRANAEFEKAQRQFKKSQSVTPLQAVGDRLLLGL
jgi:hypothetical protein